jgi:hypothetical protein
MYQRSELTLSRNDIGRILNFLGYGNPSAPIWFIGLEEGLGQMDSQDTVENLKARANFDRTMDLSEAHLRLIERGRPIAIEEKPPSTQVWQWMAKIMLGWHGGNYRDRIAVRKYIQYQLGRSHGETFLTELSPIPSARTNDKTWRDWFEKQEPELDKKINQRNCDLKRVLDENPRSLVICYGHGSAQVFAKFLEIEWQSVCPGISRSEDSRRLLLPFLGVGQMSQQALENLLQSKLLECC